MFSAAMIMILRALFTGYPSDVRDSRSLSSPCLKVEPQRTTSAVAKALASSSALMSWPATTSVSGTPGESSEQGFEHFNGERRQ